MWKTIYKPIIEAKKLKQLMALTGPILVRPVAKELESIFADLQRLQML